jgi:hypothetical protein
MLNKNLCLLILLAVFAAVLPAQQSPKLKSARVVFIENATDDPFVLDSAHLILAASQIGWTGTRDKADLILSFGSKASEGNRSTSENTIAISIKNFYTLDVRDNSGTPLWNDSVEFDAPMVRKDRTERSWIEFLHKHPVAKLTSDFLKATEK